MPSDPDDGSGPLDVDAAFAEIVAHWGDGDSGEDTAEGRSGADAPAPRPATPDAPGTSPVTGPTDSRPTDSRSTDSRSTDAARTVRPARPLPPAPREEVPRAPLDHDDVDPVFAGPDDRFVPPEPPPLPRDVVGWAAWVAVIGAPLFLLVVALAWHSVPPLVTAATAVVFVAGFATLVVRLPSSRDDDSDDGAVV